MRTVKIVDIAEQIRGVSYNPEDVFDTAQENTVPLLRANNIQDTGLNYDDLVYVQKSKVSPKQLLRQGDILVCASSGSRHLVGKAGHVYNDFGTFGAFCKVLRPNAQLVNRNYFAHYFQSPLYRRTIANLAAGANINNIKNEHLNELQIKLPCLQEQNTIARVFDKTNAIIGKRRAQLSCLNELAKSRFIEMFGDPVENPKKWATCPLSTLGTFKNGMNFSSNERGIEIHCLGVGDFKNLSIINTPTKLPIISLALTPSAEYLLQDGDIIFVRSNGNKALVGRCVAIYTHGLPVTFGGFCIRFRVGSDAVNIMYLLRVLKADTIRKKMAGRGANIQNLNQKMLARLAIPIPPIALQNEFAAFIEQLDKSKFTIRKSLEQLETLYRALLQEYFG